MLAGSRGRCGCSEAQVEVGALHAHQVIDLVGDAQVLRGARDGVDLPGAVSVRSVVEAREASEIGIAQLLALTSDGGIVKRCRSGDPVVREAVPCPLTGDGVDLNGDGQLLLRRDGRGDAQAPAEAVGAGARALASLAARIVDSGGDDAIGGGLCR